MPGDDKCYKEKKIIKHGKKKNESCHINEEIIWEKGIIIENKQTQCNMGITGVPEEENERGETELYEKCNSATLQEIKEGLFWKCTCVPGKIDPSQLWDTV